MMRQRFILLEQFMVAVLPDTTGLFFDVVAVLNLLVLLDVVLHLLQDESVLIPRLPHAFH
jgi:hypothetical protein